jgi:uncharacterized protein YgbK (DUF1537 family)
VIVVLADDFSGAAELAGLAASRGWSAEVQTSFDPSSGAEVIAFDADTRQKCELEAVRITHEVTRQVIAAKPAWIFKKTDSVLRGHIRAEIEAVMSTAAYSECVFIPANPSIGRVIVGGRYLVNGVPLDETPFACDPEFPRRSANVLELLGKPTRIVTPSFVASQADLPSSLPKSTLASGAADFFASLLGPSRLPASQRPFEIKCERTLLLCGSLSGWNAGRADEMRSQRFVVKTLGSPLTDATWSESSRLMLAIGHSIERGDRDLVAELVAAAQPLLADKKNLCIAVEGGATARVFIDCCGWTRLQALPQSTSGVGALLPPGGPLILVKPGSYPWPGSLARYGGS